MRLSQVKILIVIQTHPTYNKYSTRAMKNESIVDIYIQRSSFPVVMETNTLVKSFLFFSYTFTEMKKIT